MSPEAIDRRLRELGQLYELGIQISSARWLGALKDIERSSEKSAGMPISEAEKRS
jgi:hypothetical protein